MSQIADAIAMYRKVTDDDQPNLVAWVGFVLPEDIAEFPAGPMVYRSPKVEPGRYYLANDDDVERWIEEAAI